MKKLIGLLFVFLIFNIGQAKEIKDDLYVNGHFYVGLSIIENINTNYNLENKYGVNIGLGVEVEKYLKTNISLLFIPNLGVNIYPTKQMYNDFKLYINVPILFKGKFGKNNKGFVASGVQNSLFLGEQSLKSIYKKENKFPDNPYKWGFITMLGFDNIEKFGIGISLKHSINMTMKNLNNIHNIGLVLHF